MDPGAAQKEENLKVTGKGISHLFPGLAQDRKHNAKGSNKGL